MEFWFFLFSFLALTHGATTMVCQKEPSGNWERTYTGDCATHIASEIKNYAIPGGTMEEAPCPTATTGYVCDIPMDSLASLTPAGCTFSRMTKASAANDMSSCVQVGDVCAACGQEFKRKGGCPHLTGSIADRMRYITKGCESCSSAAVAACKAPSDSGSSFGSGSITRNDGGTVTNAPVTQTPVTNAPVTQETGTGKNTSTASALSLPFSFLVIVFSRL